MPTLVDRNVIVRPRGNYYRSGYNYGPVVQRQYFAREWSVPSDVFDVNRVFVVGDGTLNGSLGSWYRPAITGSRRVVEVRRY